MNQPEQNSQPFVVMLVGFALGALVGAVAGLFVCFGLAPETWGIGLTALPHLALAGGLVGSLIAAQFLLDQDDDSAQPHSGRSSSGDAAQQTDAAPIRRGIIRQSPRRSGVTSTVPSVRTPRPERLSMRVPN
jgi:hypothetical protein